MIFEDDHLQTARNHSQEHGHFCIVGKLHSVDIDTKSPYETNVEVGTIVAKFDCGKQVK